MFDKLDLSNQWTTGKNFERCYDKRRGLVASGFIFLPEKANEPYNRLRLLIQEEKSGDDSKDLINEMIAIIESFSDNQIITSTQNNFNQN